MALPLAFLDGVDPWILGFSFLTVAATIWMGFRSAKTSKTASDFFVAGRSVSVGWIASAISGEYLSAASFMGIAGMVMASGYDVLWYPVCYACGYLFLLLFIAGPLRRFGAYTIPDFAEGRYDSPLFRKIAVCFVLFIGFVYTLPQMKGAGVTLAYIFPGMPYWGGVVLVGDKLFGDRDDNGNPWCADFTTGGVVWSRQDAGKQKGNGGGSAAITYADGKLYIHYANSWVALVDATADKYTEISSFRVVEKGNSNTWAHPVVVGGKLYIREVETLYCYDIAAK